MAINVQLDPTRNLNKLVSSWLICDLISTAQLQLRNIQVLTNDHNPSEQIYLGCDTIYNSPL